MNITSIRLEDDLLNKVDKKAKEKAISRTSFLKIIIEDFFKENKYEEILRKQFILSKINDVNAEIKYLKTLEAFKQFTQKIVEEESAETKAEIEEINLQIRENIFELNELKDELEKGE